MPGPRRSHRRPAPGPDRFGEIRVATCPRCRCGSSRPDFRRPGYDRPWRTSPGGRPRRLAVRARRARAPVGGPHPDPAVAIYQTDVPSYLAQHTPGRHRHPSLERRVAPGSGACTLTPTSPSPLLGDDRGSSGTTAYRGWSGGAGAWTTPSSPEGGGDAGGARARRALSPAGEVLIGYVGRLAPEKELHRLAEAATIPGTRLVIVGDGPARSGSGPPHRDRRGHAGAANRTPIFLGPLATTSPGVCRLRRLRPHRHPRDLRADPAGGLPQWTCRWWRQPAVARSTSTTAAPVTSSARIVRAHCARQRRLVADPQLRASMGEVRLARIGAPGAFTAGGRPLRASRVTRRSPRATRGLSTIGADAVDARCRPQHRTPPSRRRRRRHRRRSRPDPPRVARRPEVCRGVADRRQGPRQPRPGPRPPRAALGQFVLNAGVSATDCCSSRWFAAQAGCQQDDPGHVVEARPAGPRPGRWRRRRLFIAPSKVVPSALRTVGPMPP